MRAASNRSSDLTYDLHRRLFPTFLLRLVNFLVAGGFLEQTVEEALDLHLAPPDVLVVEALDLHVDILVLKEVVGVLE